MDLPPIQSNAEDITFMLLLYGNVGSLARNCVRIGHSSSSSARDSATADQTYREASRYGQCWAGF